MEDNYLIVLNFVVDGFDVIFIGDCCINFSCYVGGGIFYKWCYKDWEKI